MCAGGAYEWVAGCVGLRLYTCLHQKQQRGLIWCEERGRTGGMAQSNYRLGGDDFIEVTPSPGVAVPPASPPVTFSASTITADLVCPALHSRN